MVTKMTTSNANPNPTDDPALTAYALGELDAAEAARIEERLADDDEARRAVEEIRRTAEALTRELAAEPAASLGAAFREVLVKEYVDSARRRSGTATKRRPTPSSVRLLLAPIRQLLRHPSSRLAAAIVVAVGLITLLVPTPRGRILAQDGVIMVPEGGRLEALDPEGNILGPCPLKHTDVDVEVSGFFSRVSLTQTYHNPYAKKIEAVYTFPLSHRAAVDRMTMTIGDRVVVGEVKERQLARRIYEAARAAGYVASLLEQERPNIFTQSVANIEPGAEVVVEISYVEILQSTDGLYRFDFPMVVGPRYIPGAPTTSPALVPTGLALRHGLVRLGPAELTVGAAGEVDELGTLQSGKLDALLKAAQPIRYPGDAWWGRGDATGGAGQAKLWYRFEAGYCDGSRELGELYTDGTGQLNGRWFYTNPTIIKDLGTGFAQDTNQVPDASRITPEPVKPGVRAGHDISVTVTIDTGGPGLLDLKSELHEIEQRVGAKRADGLPRKATLTLANKSEIPNRDFVLSWRQTADSIQEATFAHTSNRLGDYSGGFFTLILQPPDRVVDAEVPPRELVFVMDTSGSMSGFPIEKSKAVMTRAIDAMRPRDTFNVITFAGHTDILWERPRPANAANRAAAKAFVESRQGGGGTEMMTAINAALVQTVVEGPPPLTPRQLADLPADGRDVTVAIDLDAITMWPPPNVRSSWMGPALEIGDWPPLQVIGLPDDAAAEGRTKLHTTGRWITRNQRRTFEIDHWQWVDGPQNAPMRIVLFLTDGHVGNDMAIIDAVGNNAHTTRVFSFGIGNSVNRYLIDGMARAGRGEAEFVLLESDADDAVARFTKRVETPVLTDIELSFSDGLEVTDLIPPPDAVPDLFDTKPLVIHGRYGKAGAGTLTIRGRTGAGAYERTIELTLPEAQPDHDVIATLWARAKVERITNANLAASQRGTLPAEPRKQVIALGEQFGIMTRFTSFVAVERSRLTIDGDPVMVAVPIEMPAGVSYEGIFGEFVEGAKTFFGRLREDDTEFVAVNGYVNINTATQQLMQALKSGVNASGVLDIADNRQIPYFSNAPELDLDSALNQGQTEGRSTPGRFGYQSGTSFHVLPRAPAVGASVSGGGGGGGRGGGGGDPGKDLSLSGQMHSPGDWPQISMRRDGGSIFGDPGEEDAR
ncbi:MAG: VWA domain-containing protein, partial [Planctomycetes bacterium]|nr:VWA domain-containing protein [Planctomycetota bacterium]